MQLILGSSSTARASVLAQLKVPFQQVSPNVDESPIPGESVADMVERLAILKAQAVHKIVDQNALIITGDQVLSVDERVLGKPHTPSAAQEQLLFCSEKTATFYSSICLWDNRNHTYQLEICPTTIQFAQLTIEMIQRYIAIEQPLACAGSFKAEGLGITLIESMECNEPTAILGLPILTLSNMLKAVQFCPIQHAKAP